MLDKNNNNKIYNNSRSSSKIDNCNNHNLHNNKDQYKIKEDLNHHNLSKDHKSKFKEIVNNQYKTNKSNK